MEHLSEAEWTIENFTCWMEEVHGGDIESPRIPTSFDLYPDNMSYWNEEEMHGSSVRCPRFTSLWFSLSPRGESGQEEYMEVYIDSPDVLPPGELSFLCSDGSLILSQQVENPDEYSLITVRGPQFEEALTVIKEKEEDTLTLRYRFKSEEENKHQVRTVIDVIDTTFKINPVALGCGKPISDFKFQKNNKAYRAYLSSIRNGNVTQLQVEFPYMDSVLFFKTCVSFIKVGYVLEKYEEKEHIFREKEQWVFFSINDREFAERGVAVLLRLKIITGIVHSEPSLWAKGVSLVSNKSACFPEQVSSESAIASSEQIENSLIVLSKELMCLFQDKDFSDLQLRCGGMSFHVHRAVLSARSPVFKRLLSSDMREAASGSVDIEDMDAPTLARFLAFLYTGAVGEDLHAESALKLYYAADKYIVSTLKKDCVKFLSANVSLSNVCEILSVADKHGGDQLTEVSRNFILGNYNQVLASENWKTFMKKEPLLAVETLTHFAGNVRVKRQRCK